MQTRFFRRLFSSERIPLKKMNHLQKMTDVQKCSPQKLLTWNLMATVMTASTSTMAAIGYSSRGLLPALSIKDTCDHTHTRTHTHTGELISHTLQYSFSPPTHLLLICPWSDSEKKSRIPLVCKKNKNLVSVSTVMWDHHWSDEPCDLRIVLFNHFQDSIQVCPNSTCCLLLDIVQKLVAFKSFSVLTENTQWANLAKKCKKRRTNENDSLMVGLSDLN